MIVPGPARAEADDSPRQALLVENLTRAFGPVVALDRVSLAVEAGQAYGLVGPNGGGKSTLLRIVATMERPTSGRVLVGGIDPAEDPGAVRAQIGYAGPPVATPTLTAAEELDVNAQLRGIGPPARREVVPAMLQLVDLYDRRDRLVAHLSLGDRKRLALARALVHDPPLLLLDGPFDGLDGAARDELRAVLCELAALGKALLIAGASVAEVTDLCDPVGVLDRGRLVLVGPAEVLLAAGDEEARLIRLQVAGGALEAHRVLTESRFVTAIEQPDDATFLLRFWGSETDQADLLVELVRAGARVVELRQALAEAEAELSRAMRLSA